MTKPKLTILSVALVLGVLALIAATAFRTYAPSPAPAAPVERPQQTSTLLRSGSNHMRACLHDPVLAQLELGERDRDVLASWAIRRCGGVLSYYIVSELQRPKADADRYIRGVVDAEIAFLMKGWR